jgi:hypothetical protein
MISMILEQDQQKHRNDRNPRPQNQIISIRKISLK